MAEVTTSRWQALRNRYSGTGLVVEPVDPGVEGCLMGVDADGRMHLLVAVVEEPRSLPPDLQGITVRVIEVERSYLDVSWRGHHEPLFTPLANRIVVGIAVQRRDPFAVVTDAIEEFRAALKPISPDLTVGEQIGLFGELWVLRHVLLPNIGTRACFLWSGPLRERHDFAGASVHLEVKTTTGSDERHEISRLDQLRAPAGKRLLFASIMLERSIGGDETLASMIDAVMDAVGRDGRAVDALEVLLANMGWHDGLRQTGSLLRFNLRGANFFTVEGAFPRLPDGYVPPRGVVGVRYSIDVAAVPTLSADEVVAILAGM